MKSKTFSIGLTALLAVLSVTPFVTATRACAQTEKVLYSFKANGKDGEYPYAGLISDGSGNLYGTTFMGGIYQLGTVFELMPKSGGGWTEKVLHAFGKPKDGQAPYAGLTRDVAGNLYGTTIQGGTGLCMGQNGVIGCGTVFELIPRTGGGWTEKVLHNFIANDKDGVIPRAGIILDSDGNLYGATAGGGTYGCGMAFELKPRTGGGWTEKILHTFGSSGTDGCGVDGTLVFDGGGNLYGTTNCCEGGTVFELSPQASGNWLEKIVFNFGGANGSDPAAGLIFDPAGNLYGTALGAGAYGFGTALELSPGAGGVWTPTAVYAFGNLPSPENPTASLVMDSSGNLYGTTLNGGTHGFGAAFKLTPAAGGGWAKRVP